MSTIAILLGASEWPKSEGRLSGSRNFANSCRDFRRYLVDANGLAIPEDHLLDLFDSTESPSDVDEQISIFIKSVRERTGGPIKNVILYYVGHGLFSEDGQKYCIALRSTRLANVGASGYIFSSLARTLNKQAYDARRFVILDACYAAAASGDMLPQSQQAELAEKQVISALAESGTALLCAASSSDVALSPRNRNYTMFSEALLHTLTSDAAREGTLLSFDDIRRSIEGFVTSSWREEAVKPELHIPDQRKGDISKIAFFPNIYGRSAQQQADQLKRMLGRIDEIVGLQVILDERLRYLEDQQREQGDRLASVDRPLSETDWGKRTEASLKDFKQQLADLKKRPSTRRIDDVERAILRVEQSSAGQDVVNELDRRLADLETQFLDYRQVEALQQELLDARQVRELVQSVSVLSKNFEEIQKYPAELKVDIEQRVQKKKLQDAWEKIEARLHKLETAQSGDKLNEISARQTRQEAFMLKAVPFFKRMDERLGLIEGGKSPLKLSNVPYEPGDLMNNNPDINDDEDTYLSALDEHTTLTRTARRNGMGILICSLLIGSLSSLLDFSQGSNIIRPISENVTNILFELHCAWFGGLILAFLFRRKVTVRWNVDALSEGSHLLLKNSFGGRKFVRLLDLVLVESVYVLVSLSILGGTLLVRLIVY